MIDDKIKSANEMALDAECRRRKTALDSMTGKAVLQAILLEDTHIGDNLLKLPLSLLK